MNSPNKTLFVINETVYNHIERPLMLAVIEEVTGYINSLGSARTAVISVSFQPDLTPRLHKLLKVTVTLGGALLKETGDVLAYTSSIKLSDVSMAHLPEQARAVVATSLEAARAIRNQITFEGIRVLREMPDAHTATVIGPGLPPQMFGDPPTCPDCGHVGVAQNGFYKCLNCKASLGPVSKADRVEVPVVDSNYICPKCRAQMTDDGPHKKCHNCGHSTQYA